MKKSKEKNPEKIFVIAIFLIVGAFASFVVYEYFQPVESYVIKPTDPAPEPSITSNPNPTPPPTPEKTQTKTVTVTQKPTPPPTPKSTPYRPYVEPTAVRTSNPIPTITSSVTQVTYAPTPIPPPTSVSTPIPFYTTKNPIITRIEWYFFDGFNNIKLTDAFPRNSYGFVRVYYRSESGTKYIGSFNIEVRENVPIFSDNSLTTNYKTISIDSTIPETYIDTSFRAPTTNSIFIRISNGIFDLSGTERERFPNAEIKVI